MNQFSKNNLMDINYRKKSFKDFYFYFFCIVCFLIPYYKYRLQFDFRLYVAILYFLNFFFTSKLTILNRNNSYFNSFRLFFVWILLTSFFSMNIEFTLFFVERYLYIFIFFLLAVKSLDSLKRIQSLNNFLIFGFFLQIFIVIMQFIGVKAFYLTPDKDLNQNTVVTDLSGEILSTRYWGSFGETLALSTFLSFIGIGFLVYRFEKYGISLVNFFFVVLNVFVIYLTGSRAGLAIFVVTLVVYLYRNSTRRGTILVISSVITLLAITTYDLIKIFSSDSKISRFAAIKSGDLRYRLWTEGFKILSDSPIYGSVIGCLNYKLQKYNLLASFVKGIQPVGHVENVYLTYLFTTGIVGFILFLRIVFKSVRNIIYFDKKMHTEKIVNQDVAHLSKAYKYSFCVLLSCMFFEPSVGTIMSSSMNFLLICAIMFSFSKLSLKIEIES